MRCLDHEKNRTYRLWSAAFCPEVGARRVSRWGLRSNRDANHELDMSRTSSGYYSCLRNDRRGQILCLVLEQGFAPQFRSLRIRCPDAVVVAEV
jgi:hypothetical protein